MNGRINASSVTQGSVSSSQVTGTRTSHNSACAETRFDDLREGQAATFERGQGPKRPRGENVKVCVDEP
jgi:hypothetical protein